MTTPIYFTTTIPYVNARPHVGFALELVQADALARYHRRTGRSVRFQTGTDDNAFSNVLSARQHGVPVAELVEQNSAAFQGLCGALDIAHDRFLCTTEAVHHTAVRSFLARLRPQDTYVQSYRGLYCTRCEDFYLDRAAEAGVCPEHGTVLEEVEETNHFFRLSAYPSAIRDLVASRRLEVVPRVRETEVLRFIDRELVDFSISRSAGRAGGWGVPFPGEPDQVVYVWVDALINYLTGLDYPEGDDLTRFWSSESQRVHVIGKNVWKFHAIYWPALLLSAGLEAPSRIFAHGFLTENGKKISKSAGGAGDPLDYTAKYGVDAVRHFLLAHTRPYEDTDFSLSRLETVYRADLANTLGNLCSRLTALCETAGLAGVHQSGPPPSPEGYHESLDRFRFDLAAASLWEAFGQINREIAEQRPWEGLENGPSKLVVDRLRDWTERLASLAYWLQPFLPSTSSRITEALTAPQITKCRPLFPKLA